MTNLIEFICPERYKNIIPEPVPCYKEFPEWFSSTKNISVSKSKCPFNFLHDKKLIKNTNIKKCPGVTDFLKTGYVIKNWTNILVRSETPSGNLYFDWEHNYHESVDYGLHSSEEYDGMIDSELPIYNGFHKISSPWYVKTSPGVSCYYTHPFWNREKRFTTVSGIIHTDISPISIKWFFEWNTILKKTLSLDEIDSEIQFIKKDTPLIMIFPFVRNQFNMKINYLEEENFKSDVVDINFLKTHDWFGNSLYNLFRKKQRIEFK